MSKPSFVYVTYIAAAPEKVWHALTDAKTTGRYLSGFHVALEPKVGGASLFKKGEQVLNRGTVLNCDPPRKLSVTWRPEVGEFSDEKPYSNAAGYVGEGWTRVAASLKSFVETGEGMDLLSQVEGASA